MEQEHPLVFGDAPSDVARRMNGEVDLEHVARKVIAALRPLEPFARARVIRAVQALLGLD